MSTQTITEFPIKVSQTTGFARGTRVRTEHGERAVETLVAGDRVIARHGKIVTVINVSDSMCGADSANQGVLIEQGALGNDLPRRDLMVGPRQKIQVNDDQIAAMDLGFMEGIKLVSNRPSIRFVSIEFDKAEVIYCSGLEMPAEPLLGKLRKVS